MRIDATPGRDVAVRWDNEDITGHFISEIVGIGPDEKLTSKLCLNAKLGDGNVLLVLPFESAEGLRLLAGFLTVEAHRLDKENERWQKETE